MSRDLHSRLQMQEVMTQKLGLGLGIDSPGTLFLPSPFYSGNL